MASQNYSTAPATYPGKGLGIAALIVSFFFSLIGLILGIVALNQSKQAGFKNTPAVAAIWVGAALLVISVIAFIAITALAAAASTM